MITIELMEQAYEHFKKAKLVREGPYLLVKGSQLNRLLDTDKYRTDKVYYGTSIADMREGGYATIRVAKKGTRRKSKN